MRLGTGAKMVIDPEIDGRIQGTGASVNPGSVVDSCGNLGTIFRSPPASIGYEKRGRESRRKVRLQETAWISDGVEERFKFGDKVALMNLLSASVRRQINRNL